MKLYQLLAAILAFKLLDLLYAWAFVQLGEFHLGAMTFVTGVWVILAAMLWYGFRFVADLIKAGSEPRG